MITETRIKQLEERQNELIKQMNKLKCLKCNHEWLPRKQGRPAACPACNCRKWDDKNAKRRSVK